MTFRMPCQALFPTLFAALVLAHPVAVAAAEVSPAAAPCVDAGCQPATGSAARTRKPSVSRGRDECAQAPQDCEAGDQQGRRVRADAAARDRHDRRGRD